MKISIKLRVFSDGLFERSYGGGGGGGGGGEGGRRIRGLMGREEGCATVGENSALGGQ